MPHTEVLHRTLGIGLYDTLVVPPSPQLLQWLFDQFAIVSGASTMADFREEEARFINYRRYPARLVVCFLRDQAPSRMTGTEVHDWLSSDQRRIKKVLVAGIRSTNPVFTRELEHQLFVRGIERVMEATMSNEGRMRVFPLGQGQAPYILHVER